MSDGDGRDPYTAQDPTQLLHQMLTQAAVQRAHGLIQQQQPGGWRKAACQGHTLLFPSRQIYDATVPEGLQPNQFEHLMDASLDSVAGQFLHTQTECHVLRDRSVGKESVILEHQDDASAMGRHVPDVLSLQPNAPGFIGFEPGDDAQ